MSQYSGRHRNAAQRPALQQAVARPLVPIAAVTATSGVVAWAMQTAPDASTTSQVVAVAETGPSPEVTPAGMSGTSHAMRASRSQTRTTSLDAMKAAAHAEVKAVAEAKAKAQVEAKKKAEQAAKDRENSEPDTPIPAGDPRAIAKSMMAARGWGSDQFKCLNSLWNRESNWNHRAKNPSSGAYGIPQSLPGSKMASAGADWRTNPATQIKWGLQYIAGRYGTPCKAWAHSERVGWY